MFIRSISLVIFLSCGCASQSIKPYPWNFPPEEEWNAPLEFSWVNFVDNWRRFTAPKGKIYDPVMRSYQPNMGEEVGALKKKKKGGGKKC